MNINKIFNELEKKFTLSITENTIEISCKKESYPEQYVRLNINETKYYNVTYINRDKEKVLETSVNEDEAYLLAYFYSLSKFLSVDYDRKLSDKLLNDTSNILDILNILRLSLDKKVYDSINTEFGVSIEKDELLEMYNIFIFLDNKKRYIQKNLSLSIAGLVLYNYSVKIEMFNKFAKEIEFSSKDTLFQKAREYYILG